LDQARNLDVIATGVPRRLRSARRHRLRPTHGLRPQQGPYGTDRPCARWCRTRMVPCPAHHGLGSWYERALSALSSDDRTWILFPRGGCPTVEVVQLYRKYCVPVCATARSSRRLDSSQDFLLGRLPAT